MGYINYLRLTATSINEENVLYYFFSLFILRNRDRDREKEGMHLSRGGAEREEERESQAGSSQPAQCPMWGSTPRIARSQLETKSRVSA